jgi:anti-sigma B factor antagonist
VVADALIELRRKGGATVVRFTGDADLPNGGTLRDTLAQVVATGEEDVVVDLRESEFIDSSGISTLLNALRRLTRQGRGMAVVADQPAVVRPLEIAHLSDTLRLSSRVREALARL